MHGRIRINSLEEVRELCLSKGIDVEKIVKGVQPIAFEMLYGHIHWAARWH